MKPYLKEKRIKYFPGKKDVHPIKKFFVNWWENIDTFISRHTLKQKINREIENEQE